MELPDLRECLHDRESRRRLVECFPVKAGNLPAVYIFNEIPMVAVEFPSGFLLHPGEHQLPRLAEAERPFQHFDEFQHVQSAA